MNGATINLCSNRHDEVLYCVWISFKTDVFEFRFYDIAVFTIVLLMNIKFQENPFEYVFIDYHLQSLVLDETQLLAKAPVTFQLKYFLIFQLSHSHACIMCLVIWSSVIFQRLVWALCCKLESKANTLKSKVCVFNSNEEEGRKLFSYF